MSNFIDTLSKMARPKLLVRAAKYGTADYNRTRDLKRLIGDAGSPGEARVVNTLIEKEATLEATRKAGSHEYSFSNHINVLVALIEEARLQGSQSTT